LLQSFTLNTNGGEKPPAICLFTDSLEPSGVGEHMLALASQLIATYAILFVCPPTAKGYGVLDRARQLGCQTLALEVRGDRAASAALAKQLRALAVEVFHCHAGIGRTSGPILPAAQPAPVRSEARQAGRERGV
jgi:hypothetical protein